MGRRSEHRRRMTRYLVEALKEEKKLGEVLESEPDNKASRKIQELLSDVANEIADENRRSDGDNR